MSYVETFATGIKICEPSNQSPLGGRSRVRKRWYTIPHEIMGFFVHAQTVDTRPLLTPPTWPGYEAGPPPKQYSREGAHHPHTAHSTQSYSREGVHHPNSTCIRNEWATHICLIYTVRVLVEYHSTIYLLIFSRILSTYRPVFIS